MNAHIRGLLRAVVVFAMAAAFSRNAFCATVNWDAGGGNNLWSNPTNWSTNLVPTPSDDVVITNATSFDSVSLDQDATVNSINVGTGVTLTVEAGQVLTINNSSTVGGELQLAGGTPSGGSLSGNGSLTVNGTFGVHGNCTASGSGAVTVNSSGVLQIGSTGASAVISISRDITNAGTMTFLSTSVVPTTFDGATITNTGTIDIQNNHDLDAGLAPPILHNNSGGVITKSAGSGTTELNFTVNNAAGATIQAQAGNIALNGGGTASGTYSISSSRILSLTGLFTMSGLPAVTGGGTFLIDAGATLDVDAGVGVTCPNVTLSSGGTITGDGDLHVSGNFTWSGGTISGGGTHELKSTSTPTISCSTANCVLDGAGTTLRLQASGTFSASGNVLVFSNGANLIIDAGKTLNITNDGDFSSGVGGGSISNNGTIRKQTTAGTSTIGVPVTLSGTSTVDIDAGILQFGGGAGVASGATLDIAASRTLEVTGGVFLFNSGTVSMPGSGVLTVSGGTLRAATSITITIPHLTMGSGVIDGAGAVQVSGNFAWNGGTIAGGGARVLTSTSVPTISCSAGNCLLDGAALQFQAFSTYSASSNALVFSNGANLTLDPGQTINVTNDGDFLSGVGGGSITIGGFASGFNACIWKTNTSGTSIIGVPVTMDGSFKADTGTLQVSAGVTAFSGAIVHYSVGATIEVTGGVFLFNSSSVSFPANGAFKVSGGTLRAPTGITITMPNVTLQGSGVIDGGGTLNLTGTSTWSGGTMGSATAPGGVTQINSGNTLNVSGGTLTQNRILRNNGTLNLPASGGISGPSSTTIENNGTIARSAGSGTIFVGPRVENNNGATVSVATGTLSLVGGGIAGGAYAISSGATLSLASGTFSVISTATITGAGTFSATTGGILDAGAGVDLTIPNLTLSIGGTIAGPGTVRVSGNFTWSGGTITGSGPRVLNGPWPTISCSAANCLLDGGTLQLQVWGTYSASSNALVLSNGASLILDPGQVLFVTNDGDFVNGGGAASSISIGGFSGVNGCIEKTTTSGTSIIGVPVMMDGSFKVVAGTLQVAAGVTAVAGAIVHADPGTTVEVTGGLFLFNSSSVSFPANGAFKVSAGTLRVPASVTITMPNATLQGSGVIDGGGTLILSGTSTWSGGTMGSLAAPGGITQINSGNTLNITAPVTLTGRTLQNAGTLNVSGDVTGSGTIANNGALNALASLTLGAAVNNNGQIATSAALSLPGGGTHSGSFTVTAPGNLSFSSGAHSMSGGTIGGTGTLTFSGATATVGVPVNAATLNITAGTATLNGGGAVSAFTMTGGTLGGSGTLTLNNGGTWSGGTMSGGGTTINPATKSLGITAPVALTGRTLQNDGTLDVSGDITGSGTIANNGTLNTVGNVTIAAAVNNSGQIATSASLSLASGGTHGGSFTVTAPGSIAFTAGTHSILGSIGGSGTLAVSGAAVTVSSPFTAGTLNVSAGTATLNGSGAVGAFSMTGGTLGGSGTLTLTNGGTWSGGAMSGGGTTVNPATKSFAISAPVTLSGRTLQNDGTLSVNADVAGSGTIANNGTLNAAGNITIGAAMNNSGQIAAGALLSLGGNGAHSGTFTATAPGVIDFSGGTQTISGTLAGTGTVRFSGAAATVTGAWSGMPVEVAGGSVALDTNGTIPALTLSGGTLAGSGNVTVSGPSTWSGGTIAGSGAFTFDAGATVTMPGTSAVTLARPLLNQGTINFTAASNGMLNTAPGTPPFVNAGTLKKSGGSGVMQFAAPISNTGLVQIESGTMHFSGTYAQTAGTTTILPGATLQTATLSLDGGSLTGNGTVAGTVANDAAVSPGASPGTLTINGDYVQSPNGVLDVEIGGTAPGTQYDRLVVSGTITLDGTLNVTTINGFAPTPGNAFQILTFGARNSAFAVMNGLANSETVLVPTFGVSDLQLITNPVEADLAVSVSAPPSVAHGSAFAYTVSVVNGGGVEANGVSITAALPPNVTFTGASPPICSGATNLVCSIGRLGNQSAASVAINVTAGGAGAAPISVMTTAIEPDPNTANNTASVSPLITPVADLHVAVAGPVSTIAGTKVIYTVTVSNSGPDTAAGVAVTATASPGLTFSGNGGACAGSFPCNIGALSSGQSATIQTAWDIAPSAAGSVQLTVTASSPTTDPNSPNNSASAATIIGTCPTITIVAPTELTTGAAAAAAATPFEGATYDWSIDNGTIDSGAGTASITFTTGQAGTTRLAVNVAGSGCVLGAAHDVTVKPPRTCVGTAAPTEPANGTTTADAVVAFAWSSVEGASGYRLWLQRGDEPARSLGTTLGTSRTKIILPGAYRWYVETLFDGCASHESEQIDLTILPAQDCASRGAPRLSAPANDAAVASAAVTFSWNAEAKALEYELWLAPAGGVPTLIRTTSDTSATAIVPPGRLEWYVRAIFAGCDATESDHRAFTYTQPAECTSQRPLLIAPVEGERLTSPVSLEWTNVPGAASYELYVDGVLAATTTFPNASGIAAPPGERRWKVRARLAEGCGALDSAESRFAVIAPLPSCSPLEAPVISAPAQISSGVAGRIQWSFVAGATAYVLEISEDPRFPRGSTSSATVTARQVPFNFTNQSSEPVARYVRVHAVDTNCVQTKTGPFSPVAVLFVLPPAAGEGTVLMTDPTDLSYTLNIPAELAGQSFTATPSVPWLTVTPASGIVPPGGQTLRAVAHTAGLPPGTSTATVAITTTAAAGPFTALANLPVKTPPIPVNNIPGVTTKPKSTPPPDSLIIPAVANVTNFIVRYRSDIAVTNTSAQVMKYEIDFVPGGPAGMSEGQKTNVSLEPGATLAITDIVATWFGGRTSTGTLEIRPLTEIEPSTSSAPADGPAHRVTFASSRTFSTTAAGGTYGQYVPAVPYANFVARGSTLSLQHIAQSDKYRTNLGLVEGSGEKVSVEVRIFDAAGTKLKSFNVDLNGGERAQLNGVLKEHGLTLDDGRIEVEATSGAGKVTAYASVVDNATNDPQLVPPVILDRAGHSKWVVPGVAALAGGSGDWQTDVRIFNAGTEAADLTMAFYSMNGGPATTRSITVAAGEVRQLDRVLSFFGILGDAGALHVSSAAPAQIVITARTYNQTGGGAYGQFISAASPDEAVAVGSRPLQILQMEQSDRFQANIGVVEVSGKPVTLEVAVFRPNSNAPAMLEVKLEPNQFRQLNSLLSSLGLGETFNARISVRAVAGEGRALAYGSLIDQKTSDPTYIPGQ